MNILVWGQENSLKQAAAKGYASAASKDELFERSDVLSLHVRLTRETRGIVGANDLARMKPTALIVNTARAEIIAPGALLAALRNGRPGYAAVDVYEQEPIVNGNHPFLSMPNVLCTPHLGWAEWDNFELYFREAFEQIVAYERASRCGCGIRTCGCGLRRLSARAWTRRSQPGPKEHLTCGRPLFDRTTAATAGEAFRHGVAPRLRLECRPR